MPRVKFDVARSIEARVWRGLVDGGWGPGPISTRDFRPNRDEANDDDGWRNDEVSITPLRGRIYHFDSPGYDLTAAEEDASDRLYYTMNALEFVRVQIGRDKDFRPTGRDLRFTPDFRGSRASYLTPWHTWLYFERERRDSPLARPRTAGGQIDTTLNELEEGLRTLPTAPPARP